MKTYSSYVNFLCSLMAIDIPDICYCFKEQYYDVNGFDVEPFEMESHCKSHLIPDENRIYINLNEMHGENDIYCILAHEIRHCAQYQATEGIGLADIATHETIYKWKKEFSRYNPGCNDESCQEVELDAMAFTWFIGKVLLNVDVDLNCDEALVEPYKQYIRRNYSLTEIKERLDYSGLEFGRNQA